MGPVVSRNKYKFNFNDNTTAPEDRQLDGVVGLWRRGVISGFKDDSGSSSDDKDATDHAQSGAHKIGQLAAGQRALHDALVFHDDGTAFRRRRLLWEDAAGLRVNTTVLVVVPPGSPYYNDYQSHYAAKSSLPTFRLGPTSCKSLD
jgi:hypothetical protein